MEEEKKDAGAWPVEPTQLSGASRFRFSCHRELACWCTCCHNMDVILAPNDILRLKKRLGITSSEFLQQYTTPKMHEESSLPLVILKSAEVGERACPFLGEEGCTVYEDRPSICRYYPIGLASLMAEKGGEKGIGVERFYFRIREEYCLGHGEEQEWTVDGWRANQGADRDDEVNGDWQSAFLSRSLPGEVREDSGRQALFHMVCYDLDTFRRFVLESAFLENFEVDPETVAAIGRDDEELLRFALRYMKYFMMMEETMKPRPGAVDSWRKKNRDEENGQV